MVAVTAGPYDSLSMSRSCQCWRRRSFAAVLIAFWLYVVTARNATAGDGVAYVSDSPDYVLSGRLLSALQSHAELIVLTTDYTATEDEFGAFAGNPLPITR